MESPLAEPVPVKESGHVPVAVIVNEKLVVPPVVCLVARLALGEGLGLVVALGLAVGLASTVPANVPVRSP